MAADFNVFDRPVLARHRNRVAAAAGAHAFLLDRVAEDFADRLGMVRRTFPRAVNIGAHHGVVGRVLQSSPSIETIVETETSSALLDRCNGLRVLADEEALPFADGAFDLAVSGLTLQHVNDLPGALLQIRRALKPDGLFLGALVGGDTLKELRAAWLAAETEISGGVSPRVAPFADVRDLGGLLQRAGFALPVVDSDVVTVRYDSALGLMRDIKAMGASNVLTARRRVPVTRTLLFRAAELYASMFGEAGGRVPATFEILTMTAWVPHESQQKPLRPGSATARLADALGVPEGRLPVKS